MTTKQMNRRLAAVMTANAINAIEGAPVSDYAKKLSALWARGERAFPSKVLFRMHHK